MGSLTGGDDSKDADAWLGEIADEFAQRLGRGERPTADEYVRRFPLAASAVRRTLQAVEWMQDLTASSTDDLAAPATQLGDFRIVREVGRGGMGIVYEAEQISLKRRVALKVLPFASVLDPRRLQRFKNEAMVVAQLEHPNIVNVYGTGCERGTHFYAMRFIDGRTVADLIDEFRGLEHTAANRALTNRRGAASPLGGPGNRSATAAQSTQMDASSPSFFRMVARVGVQAARAMEHAHANGVLHRDVKPSNLLMDAAGWVWISDFGLARIENEGALTTTGDVVGTLRYMSPEQMQGSRAVVDHRSDVYSLGATLYELSTLRPPFEGESRQELIHQVTNDEPRAPRRIRPEIPEDLETIMLTCLEKHPTDRYASAAELADDLDRFLAGVPIHTRRPNIVQRTVKWSRRHCAFVLTAAATFVLAVTFALAIIWQESEHVLKSFAAEREQRTIAESARQKAEQASQQATAMQRLAEQRERTARQYLYAAHMNLAQEAWERRQVGRMVQFLESQRPLDDEEDFRGFEWYHLWQRGPAKVTCTEATQHRIVAAAHANDSRVVAAIDERGAVTLWNAEAKLLRELNLDRAAATSIAVASNGRALAVGVSTDRKQPTAQVRLYSLPDAALLTTIPLAAHQATALVFSPDGGTLAVGTRRRQDDSSTLGQTLLFRALDGQRIRILHSEDQEPRALAFSHDGSALISCTSGKMTGKDVLILLPGGIRMWKLPEGNLQYETTLQGFTAASLVVLPKDECFIVGGSVPTRAEARVFGLANGAAKGTFHYPNAGTVSALDVSSDGRLLASSCSDGTIGIWDANRLREIGSLWHKSPVRLAFDNDARRAVSAGGKQMQCWDLSAPVDHAEFVWHHQDVIAGLVLTSNNRAITASYDGTIRSWDLEKINLAAVAARAAPSDPHSVSELLVDVAPSAEDRRSTARLRGLDATKDGRWLACGGERLRLVHLPDKKVTELHGHAIEVTAVEFSPDGKTLASADADGILKLWSVETARETATIEVYPPDSSSPRVNLGHGYWPPGPNFLSALLFADEGKTLVCAGMKGIRRWNVETRQELARLDGDTNGHFHCALSPDGKTLATASGWILSIGSARGSVRAGEIVLWNLAEGKRTLQFALHAFSPTSLAFSPDGKTIAAGGPAGPITLWSVTSGQEVATIGQEYLGSTVSHALRTGVKKSMPVAEQTPAMCLSFSSDGRYLVAAADPNVFRVWHAAKREAPEPSR